MSSHTAKPEGLCQRSVGSGQGTARMSHFEMQALSPLDGRYAGKVGALRPFLSEYGLIHYRLRVEIAWLLQLAAEPAFDVAVPDALRTRLAAIDADLPDEDAARVKAIEQVTNHDVKACEYFLGEQIDRFGGGTALKALVHFACTSEDINNLAYAMMLRDARDSALLPAVQRIGTQLAQRVAAEADTPMLSRTHGQPASPTTLGKEFANVLARLDRTAAEWSGVAALGKFNGAVGNFNAHAAALPELDWPALSDELITGLGLTPNPMTTQIEPHDWLAAYLHAASRMATVLLDFARDVWTYISLGYFRQRTVAGEVGSSTMPHKVNPIDFENAEGNLGVMIALAGHLATKLPRSRLQRDLTDSTALRNLGSVLGYLQVSVLALERGLGKLQVDHATLAEDLDQNWEVLAEPIQTVMRRHGCHDAYEQLKTLTRGQSINAATLRQFVDGLAAVPEPARAALGSLTPAHYTGIAGQLARDYLAHRAG